MKTSAADAARRAGLGLGGVILMTVGWGFLTVAAWIYLEEVLSALYAALIIGCVYFGLGLIFMGLAGARRRVPPPPPPPPEMNSANLLAAVISALVQGVSAGMAARKKPSDEDAAPGEGRA